MLNYHHSSDVFCSSTKLKNCCRNGPWFDVSVARIALDFCGLQRWFIWVSVGLMHLCMYRYPRDLWLLGMKSSIYSVEEMFAMSKPQGTRDL